jgi:hypothetical protein
MDSYIINFYVEITSLPADFTTPEAIHLNRVAIPFGMDSPRIPNNSHDDGCSEKNNFDVLLPHPLTPELTPDKRNP